MANVKIVLNRKGVRELLRSKDVLRELERRAEAIASAAGPGHVVDSQIGKNRARASVRTDTIDAMIAEATTRNLTRALDAGRDADAPRGLDTRRRDERGRFIKGG